MEPLHTRQTRRPFADRDGVETYVKAEGSVESFAIDWTDWLADAETILTSAWAANGVSVSGSGTSGATAYTTVSGTNGELNNTIGTSAYRIFSRTVRFIDSGDRS